jgi:hypothetical protein
VVSGLAVKDTEPAFSQRLFSIDSICLQWVCFLLFFLFLCLCAWDSSRLLKVLYCNFDAVTAFAASTHEVWSHIGLGGR